VGGCGPGDPDPRIAATIPRETFVQAYVELRVAALRNPEQRLPLQVRQRILDRIGVTEEELLTFAEVWGEDFDYMRGVWGEVDSIMRARRDNTEGPGARGNSP